MSEKRDLEQAKRIARFREAKGLGQEEVAALMDVTQTTVWRWENYGIIDKQYRTKLAEVLGVTAAEIMGFSRLSNSTGMTLRVRGRVKAGAFAEAVEIPEDEQDEVPAPIDPELQSLPLQPFIVDGDSVDLVYPDGTIVYVVPPHALGRGNVIRNGDMVLVSRTDTNGLIEMTLKEYTIDDKRVKLWPRSTNPAFQVPIDYVKGTHGDVERVEVVGIVMAAMVKARRGR